MRAMDRLEQYLLSQEELPADTILRWKELFKAVHVDTRLRAAAWRQVVTLVEEGWRGAALAFFWEGILEDAVNDRRCVASVACHTEPYAVYEVIPAAA